MFLTLSFLLLLCPFEVGTYLQQNLAGLFLRVLCS